MNPSATALVAGGPILQIRYTVAVAATAITSTVTIKYTRRFIISFLILPLRQSQTGCNLCPRWSRCRGPTLLTHSSRSGVRPLPHRGGSHSLIVKGHEHRTQLIPQLIENGIKLLGVTNRCIQLFGTRRQDSPMKPAGDHPHVIRKVAQAHGVG